MRRHIFKPLARLERTTAAIAAGDLEQRVEIGGHGEIARLGTAFDHMMGQLKKITASRDELDQEVMRRQESVLRYRQLFESMINAFALHEIILDETGRPCDYRFIEVNPMFEQLTGLKADDVVGRTVLEVLPNTESFWIETYGQVALTGEATRFENYAAELERYFEVVAYRPKAGHFAVVFTDITQRVLADKERRELQERLSQSQKMEAIGLLAGGVAHDFNNILGIIIGFAELGRDHRPPGNGEEDPMQGIITASLRARDLVRQLLTVSHDSRQNHQPLLLAKIIKESLGLIQVTLPKQIMLDTHLKDRDLRVRADATQIHQVVMNLCSNALHAMNGDPKGELAIRLKAVHLDRPSMEQLNLKQPHQLRLSVQDSGHGVPESVRHRIFDPFFTTKEIGHGSGMGLAVTHGIMRQCRGAVTLECPACGGSRFVLYFPVIGS